MELQLVQILDQVQGVVFYNEGFMLLTGSSPITKNNLLCIISGSSGRFYPRWKYWGAGARDGVVETSFDGSAQASSFKSASFGLSFQGESTTETITLYARAPRGQVNYSNNPTFIKR